MGIPLCMYVSSQITLFLIVAFKLMESLVFNTLPLVFINFMAVYCVFVCVGGGVAQSV